VVVVSIALVEKVKVIALFLLLVVSFLLELKNN
jgi:hypothetical protein